MKKIALAASALALVAAPAYAGVVITQQVNQTGGLGPTASSSTQQTIMVQGGKQKLVSEKRSMIIDADKGVVYMLDPTQKSYLEVNVASGPGGSTMAASMAASMNLKKTGATHTVIGYKCDEYTGQGHSISGDYTMTECISTTAPGANEYAAFEKMMRSKLKDLPASKIPEGVTLQSDTSMKLGKMTIPGMTPEQAAKVNEMLAKRPPVITKTVVTKVEQQNLPADTFDIPKDYTKREIPSMANVPHPMGSMAMPQPSPAAH